MSEKFREKATFGSLSCLMNFAEAFEERVSRMDSQKRMFERLLELDEDNELEDTGDDCSLPEHEPAEMCGGATTCSSALPENQTASIGKIKVYVPESKRAQDTACSESQDFLAPKQQGSGVSKHVETAHCQEQTTMPGQAQEKFASVCPGLAAKVASNDGGNKPGRSTEPRIMDRNGLAHHVHTLMPPPPYPETSQRPFAGQAGSQSNATGIPNKFDDRINNGHDHKGDDGDEAARARARTHADSKIIHSIQGVKSTHGLKEHVAAQHRAASGSKVSGFAFASESESASTGHVHVVASSIHATGKDELTGTHGHQTSENVSTSSHDSAHQPIKESAHEKTALRHEANKPAQQPEARMVKNNGEEATLETKEMRQQQLLSLEEGWMKKGSLQRRIYEYGMRTLVCELVTVGFV